MTRLVTKVIFCIIFTFFSISTIALAGPFDLFYSGRLTEETGAPIQGPINIEVKFFLSETGTDEIGVAVPAFSGVALDEGAFGITISLTSSQFNTIFSNASSVWIQVKDITHDQTYPRQTFTAVPYAMRVPVDETTLTYDSNGKIKLKNVNNLQGYAVSNTAPTPNYYLKWNGSAWASAAVTADSGGDMLQSVYDTNANNIVDNSSALEGHAASYFATSDHNHTGIYSASGHAHSGADITSGTIADDRIASTIARDSEITYKAESDLTSALNDNYAPLSHPHSSLDASDGNPTSALSVDASGNVGIGIAASSPLTVNGVIESKTGGLKFPDGTTQTTASLGTANCPAGFTSIEWNGKRMGCIKTDLVGSPTSANYQTALDYCFTNYGGRLPLVGEFQLAKSQYALSNVGNGGEWLLDYSTSFDNYAVWDGVNTRVSNAAKTTNYYYRCWIPSSVGGNGAGGIWSENGSDIYRNSGNVGIGTTTPGQKLTVAGTIESSSGGIKFPDGNIQTTSHSTYCGVTASTYTGSGVGGWSGAVSKCQTACGISNSYMCSFSDLAFYFQTGGSSLGPNSFWISDTYYDNGFGAISACVGWTSNSSGEVGSILYNGTTGSYNRCNDSFAIACCKY